MVTFAHVSRSTVGFIAVMSAADYSPAYYRSIPLFIRPDSDKQKTKTQKTKKRNTGVSLELRRRPIASRHGESKRASRKTNEGAGFH